AGRAQAGERSWPARSRRPPRRSPARSPTRASSSAEARASFLFYFRRFSTRRRRHIMEPIRTFAAKTVVLPIENVDTDQIIPARFLKVTSKVGIGAHLFA